MPPTSPATCEHLVLGAGLAGLAAARALGKGAVVLEREDRPGGVARSERVGRWHFDHAIHVLYFADDATRERVFALEGHALAACPPVAWVETAEGVARFPIQLHLGGLDPTFVSRCLADLETTFATPHQDGVRDFATFLERSFGRELCRIFFAPYNRKMWKRPLESLAPSGFQWNIVRPDLAQVRRGAEQRDARFASYNAEGWYPQPPPGESPRGIEVLARAMADGVEVRLRHELLAIDPSTRLATVRVGDRIHTLHWEGSCVATLPLPTLLARCEGIDEGLREACAGLMRNRVRSVALAIEGPRPEGTGHWRYYADESLVFNRLIWPHAFDPGMAPPDGFGLVAEVTERAEDRGMPDDALVTRVLEDARRTGSIKKGDRVVATRVFVLDPAYVVFRPGDEAVVRAAHAALEAVGIHAVGRYGRWEYSSMAQVMRDGFALGDRLAARVPA